MVFRLLPVLVEAMEQHGHLQLDPAVREPVLTVSAATIDRLLCPARGIHSRDTAVPRSRHRPPKEYPRSAPLPIGRTRHPATGKQI